MFEKRLDLKVPRQSMIYLAVCLTGILIFVLGGILPEKKRLEALNAAMVEKQYAIEEQTALAPLFKSLKADAERKDSEVLPLPLPGKLPQDKIGTLPITFQPAAQMSRMTLVSATPNLGAMTSDLRYIPVNIVLRGGVVDFRKFLIEIGGIPYIKHIEEITVQEKSDSREFKLKIWAALG